MAYIRNPRKRVVRGDSQDELRSAGRRRSEELSPDGNDMPFVRLGSSVIGTGQDVVQRIGDAIIGGDFGGNARGSKSLDIQVVRDPEVQAQWAATDGEQIASGFESILLGNYGRAVGYKAVSIGVANAADGAYSAVIGVGGLGSGDFSLVFGLNAKASGEASVAIGKGAVSTVDGVAVLAANAIKMQVDLAPSYESVITTDETSPVTGNLAKFLDVDRVGDAGVAVSGLAAAVHGHKRAVEVGDTLTLADGFSLLLAGYFRVSGSLVLLGDSALGVI